MIVRTPMRDKSRGSYHDTIFGSCPRRSCRSGLSSTMTLPPLAMASRANACDDRRTDRLEWRAISAEERRWVGNRPRLGVAQISQANGAAAWPATRACLGAVGALL